MNGEFQFENPPDNDEDLENNDYFVLAVCKFDSDNRKLQPKPELLELENAECLGNNNENVKAEEKIFSTLNCVKIYDLQNLNEFEGDKEESFVRIAKSQKTNDNYTFNYTGQEPESQDTVEAEDYFQKGIQLEVKANGILSEDKELVSTDTIIQPRAPWITLLKCLACNKVEFNIAFMKRHLQMKHFDLLENEEVLRERESEIFERKIKKCLMFLIGWENFSNHKQLEKIIAIVDIDSILLQCEFCEYIFTNVGDLWNHQIEHDSNIGFKCQSCKLDFKTHIDIIDHWEFLCPYSNSWTYVGANGMRLQKYYVCFVCWTSFTTLKFLYEHRYSLNHFIQRKSNNTSLSKFYCEYCGIVLENETSTAEHFRSEHTDTSTSIKIESANTVIKARRYLCEICGKTYAQSSHLWQHMRFHKYEISFTNDHIRKCHTKERPFECKKCGKRFLTSSVFYQHRLIHNNDRRYPCSKCERRFFRSDALKIHMRIHTGEKPFCCNFCNKTFRQRGDCDKHVRARHSVVGGKIASNKK